MNADLLNAKAFTIWVLPNGQNVGISDYHYGMETKIIYIIFREEKDADTKWASGFWLYVTLLRTKWQAIPLY